MDEVTPGFRDESKDAEIPATPVGEVKYIVARTGAVYEISPHGNRRVKDKRLARQLYENHLAAMAQRDEKQAAEKAKLETEMKAKSIAERIRNPKRIITEE